MRLKNLALSLVFLIAMPTLAFAQPVCDLGWVMGIIYAPSNKVPPGSTITLQIYDAGMTNAPPSEVVAATITRPIHNDFPLPFKIRQVKDRCLYMPAITAVVRNGKNSLYQTKTVIPVKKSLLVEIHLESVK